MKYEPDCKRFYEILRFIPLLRPASATPPCKQGIKKAGGFRPFKYGEKDIGYTMKRPGLTRILSASSISKPAIRLFCESHSTRRPVLSDSVPMCAAMASWKPSSMLQLGLPPLRIQLSHSRMCK